MKKHLSIIALLLLPACLGGGDDSSVELTPDAPDVSMNTEFGTLLNGVRTTGTELQYNSRIGYAVQMHANDMWERGYTDVTIPGTTGNNNGMEDIGDRVTAAGYTWTDILQMVAKGNFTLKEAMAEFDNSGDCGGGGQEMCITNDLLTDFGIAKAGSGDDQRWALVLAGQTEP